MRVDESLQVLARQTAVGDAVSNKKEFKTMGQIKNLLGSLVAIAAAESCKCASSRTAAKAQHRRHHGR